MLKALIGVKEKTSMHDFGTNDFGNSKTEVRGFRHYWQRIKNARLTVRQNIRDIRATKVTYDIVLRVVADILLVNFALINALVLRFLVLGFLGLKKLAIGVNLFEILDGSIYIFFQSGLILMPLSMAVFALSGFYTMGRLYSGRYKAIVILRAVVFTYLVFYLIESFIIKLPIPLSALIVGCGFTYAFVGGSRYVALLLSRAGIGRQVHKADPVWRRIQNVLVIGGGGYIGSIVCRKLLEQGFNVRVLDKLVYGDQPIAGLYSNPNFELVRGDFRNIDSIVDSMLEIDAVVHLGAIVGDPASDLDPESTLEINLLATQMVAEVAKGYGVQRLVFASTCSVYGASDGILDEQSPLNPVSLYARTKIDSENLLLSLTSDDFSPIILRFATVYGLSFRPRFDLVVNLLAARAAVEGSIAIFGGSQWRPFIHVANAADCVVHVLRSPTDVVRGQIFNVGSDDENYQIKDIGDIIKKFLPYVKVEHSGLDGDLRNYNVSFKKIADNLNFHPGSKVEDGVTEIINAMQQGWIVNYNDPQFSNVAYLKEGINLSALREKTSIARLNDLRVPVLQ